MPTRSVREYPHQQCAITTPHLAHAWATVPEYTPYAMYAGELHDRADDNRFCPGVPDND